MPLCNMASTSPGEFAMPDVIAEVNSSGHWWQSARTRRRLQGLVCLVRVELVQRTARSARTRVPCCSSSSGWHLAADDRERDLADDAEQLAVRRHAVEDRTQPPDRPRCRRLATSRAWRRSSAPSSSGAVRVGQISQAPRISHAIASSSSRRESP